MNVEHPPVFDRDDDAADIGLVVFCIDLEFVLSRPLPGGSDDHVIFVTEVTQRFMQLFMDMSAHDDLGQGTAPRQRQRQQEDIAREIAGDIAERVYLLARGWAVMGQVKLDAGDDGLEVIRRPLTTHLLRANLTAHRVVPHPGHTHVTWSPTQSEYDLAEVGDRLQERDRRLDHLLPVRCPQLGRMMMITIN